VTPAPPHLGPRLDPHRGVPQPPELGGRQRQLGHPRRRPRGPRRGLGWRHGSLPGEPRVPERRLRVVVQPAARVGQHAVVGAEHVLHGSPRRVERRGSGHRLLGRVPCALEAVEDEGHGGEAGADGVLVFRVGGGGGLPAEVERGGGRAEAALVRVGPRGEPWVWGRGGERIG
jgi:hypothetical protein